MITVPTITQDELVRRIKVKLEARPYSSSYSDFSTAPVPTEPAAYVLILGAGFSYGCVPLADELMLETIGGYYYPDQDQSSAKRPESVLRKDSANFWKELSEAAAKKEVPMVELDARGFPKNPAAAYQYLFTYKAANEFFAQPEPQKKKLSLLERIVQQRSTHHALEKRKDEQQNTGELFVKGFLRYVLDSGCEHGRGSTGRSELNLAHIYLAALLEAQQLGAGWTTCAFCRTLLTTNFDTLLQNSLQMVNLLYRLVDRPEKGLDHSDFVQEGPIVIVYLHGSILRHNPASTIDELSELKNKNIEVLREYLESRDIIVIGYGGWNDGLMAALRRCDPSRHQVYWCDVRPEPAPHVAALLAECNGGAMYVHLGESGADGLTRALYDELVPAEARRDPLQRYREWQDLVWNRNRPV